ncbi:DUF6233 domain-containing protein [Streptomyces sp. NPDC056191]|uniref:DUF6233 domain-containing protein n=1 Tax=Streptomyces sp. NPDC056191 TaxID=3345742 RepID=UPI0035E04A4D
MTTSPDEPEFEPVPIRVVLPDGQEIVGRLYARRQLPEGWVYLVSVPVYWNPTDEHVEPAEYRMWLRPQDHLKPVEGTLYDSVPTERMEPPSIAQKILGPRRPSRWVLENLGGRTGRSQAVVHAVDCAEAPKGAPLLSLDQALDAAARPGTRLCSLCGAAQEVGPVLRGFDAGFEGDGLDR